MNEDVRLILGLVALFFAGGFAIWIDLYQIRQRLAKLEAEAKLLRKWQEKGE